MDKPIAAVDYDGLSAREIAAQLALPRVVIFHEVESTMDQVHGLGASGCLAGTLVVAESQSAGRGRAGRGWISEKGAGVWFTILERPDDLTALEVLSLRAGLNVARAIDGLSGYAVGLKWPNDLVSPSGKIGGMLVEARWRDSRPDWAAIGLGLNLSVPSGVPGAAALGRGVSRIQLLSQLVPAVRAAAAARGRLTAGELEEFARRDVAAGRLCSSPRRGRVAGIAEDGSLVVVTADGVERCREGSLVLEDETP